MQVPGDTLVCPISQSCWWGHDRLWVTPEVVLALPDGDTGTRGPGSSTARLGRPCREMPAGQNKTFCRNVLSLTKICFERKVGGVGGGFLIRSKHSASTFSEENISIFHFRLLFHFNFVLL